MVVSIGSESEKWTRLLSSLSLLCSLVSSPSLLACSGKRRRSTRSRCATTPSRRRRARRSRSLRPPRTSSRARCHHSRTTGTASKSKSVSGLSRGRLGRSRTPATVVSAPSGWEVSSSGRRRASFAPPSRCLRTNLRSQSVWTWSGRRRSVSSFIVTAMYVTVISANGMLKARPPCTGMASTSSISTPRREFDKEPGASHAPPTAYAAGSFGNHRSPSESVKRAPAHGVFLFAQLSAFWYHYHTS